MENGIGAVIVMFSVAVVFIFMVGLANCLAPVLPFVLAIAVGMGLGTLGEIATFTLSKRD